MKKLAVSLILIILVMQNSYASNQYYIQETNKIGRDFGRNSVFLTCVTNCFATISPFTYLYAIMSPQNDNTCSTANNSNRSTTPTTRNVVNLIGFKPSYTQEAALPDNPQQEQQSPDNLYLVSVVKACQEFIQDEAEGNHFTLDRLKSKIEAARLLFPEGKKDLNLTIGL